MPSESGSETQSVGARHRSTQRLSFLFSLLDCSGLSEFLPLFFPEAADEYLTARHNEVMSARYHVSTQAGCAGIATMGVFLKLVLRGFWGLLVPCPSLFSFLSLSLSLSPFLCLPLGRSVLLSSRLGLVLGLSLGLFWSVLVALR